MKKAVPTTSQLKLIKNFKFTLASEDMYEDMKTISGKQLDTDVANIFVECLDLIEQIYKLSKTTKFKYGKPVDEFDLNKVFESIQLRFDSSTGIYYDPYFTFKPMGLSYLLSFIMTVRHERDMGRGKFDTSEFIRLMTLILKYVKEWASLSSDYALPVITVKGKVIDIDEEFKEEESSSEGLLSLFNTSKNPLYQYRDLPPHFTKYIVQVISKQIRRMAKRGEIDAMKTSLEDDIMPLLRGGKVIRRTKGGQPITAKVQLDFLHAVLDDLLYNEGGEDIVRQIASLDKKEFGEFMSNKQYNRSLTTIFTQFVNVAIKENLNKIGHYDVKANRFRGDSSLVAKSNVTKNLFRDMQMEYDDSDPQTSFYKALDGDSLIQLNLFLSKQIPASDVRVQSRMEFKNVVITARFRAYAEGDSTRSYTKFILDFVKERIYYSTNNYVSRELDTSEFKQIASSISLDVEDPLRDLITLLGQMTRPDKVSSRAFGGKKKIPERKSIDLLRALVSRIPKKNIVKIEGPEYNSLLGTITGGMLLGVFNSEGTILNSLTYLSFDSIRTKKQNNNTKNICMIKLYVSGIGRNGELIDELKLARAGSNCIYLTTDLSTGDSVGTVVGVILDSLSEDPQNYLLSGLANVSASTLYPGTPSQKLKEQITEAILKIPLEDMDKMLFNDDEAVALNIRRDTNE